MGFLAGLFIGHFLAENAERLTLQAPEPIIVEPVRRDPVMLAMTALVFIAQLAAILWLTHSINERQESPQATATEAP